MAYLLKTDKGALIELDIQGNLAAYKRVSRIFPGRLRFPYITALFPLVATVLKFNIGIFCPSPLQDPTCQSMVRSDMKPAAHRR